MGCIGSKTVETSAAPAAGACTEVQQRSDDSCKPWKKNRIVPAPLTAGAGEDAAPRQERQQSKASTAAFVNVGKDTKPYVDQGPKDVVADLKARCSDRVEGAGLASLAEHLFEVLKLHLPGTLRDMTSSKDFAALAEVLKRAVLCCDSILQPVLAHINRVLSSRQAGSSWSEATSWEQVEFPDFLGLLEDSCNAVYDLGVMEVGRPVVALMELIYELRQHCDAQKSRLEESACRIPALDELLGMLSIIFFRKVVLETHESAQSKLDQYLQLQEQVGWSDAQLATCTGPEARAMLMYLNQVAAAGEKRANVTVRRAAAFWDALEAARAAGLLPGAVHAPAACYKYFPAFIDTYGTEGSSRKPAVEAGEGHGPRKEFFSLAGQDMVGRAWQQQQQPQAAQVRPSDDGASSHSAAKASDPPRRPQLWVFNRTAGAYWYNTSLSESPELRDAYAFAGWLLGQSLLNRAPVVLPLPAVLFRAVLETHGTDCGSGGGGFQPSLDTLAEFDPDAAAGLRHVVALPGDQLRGLLEMEGLPPDWSAERYTEHAVTRLLRDDVAWQSEALAGGFFAAVDRRLLRVWQLGPAALATLAAGGGGAGGGGGEVPADLSSLFRLALDDELSGNSALLVELLWGVLAEWPAERRLRFVEFVTGTPRLPLPGSELLKIQAPFVAMGASEHRATLGMLPQAHTCDNLLELPNYWESLLVVRGVRGGPAAVTRRSAQLTEQQLMELRAEVRRILADRLEVAVMNFQGYGLDERLGGDGGVGDADGDDGGVVEDDDGGGGGNDQDVDALGKGLRGPEPSLEPDIQRTKRPAALTADSLASLAQFSAASSSPLHSLHPLAFSAAAAGAPAPPGGPPRAGLGGAPRLSGTNAPKGGPAAAGGDGRGAAGPRISGTVPAVAASMYAKASLDVKAMSVEERQASVLARFDVDSGPGVRSGRALCGPPQKQRQASSSEESSRDAFK